MHSNAHPALEATSLEDSTYEVLDRAGYLSDDDGNTASVASTSPDDVSLTLSETESEGEDDFIDYHTAEPPQLAASSLPDPLDAEVVAAGEDSTLTERPGLGDSDSGFHFTLDEHPLEGLTATEGYSVVKEFTPEQSTSKVLEPYGCTDIRLSVALGLADRFYPERGSFKVLFVGRLDAWSEEGIKTSLLNALLASPGSTKSIMVRGQVEPYSPVLHAAHCTGVEVQSKMGTPKRTIFKLDGSDGADLVIAHNRKQDDLPDLAIFCYPQSSAVPLSKSDYLEVRLACGMHGIPILDITDHRRFNEEHATFKSHQDALSLRVCVEGKAGSDFGPVDSLPVDVYTFMHLDPSDLNRHLAAIIPSTPVTGQSTSGRDANFWNSTGTIPTLIQQVYKYFTSNDTRTAFKMAVLLVAVAGSITAAYLGTSMLQLQRSGLPSGITQPQLTGSSAHSAISAALATTPQAIISTASAPSVKDKIDDFFSKQRQPVQIEPEKAISSVKKVAEKEEYFKAAARLSEKLEKKKAEMRRREEAAKTSKIGGFEIQTSGEQQFILRPSKGFTGRTRKPQLQIQVSRDSKDIPICYERKMDGVYVVDLADQYSVGPFNVSIATHTRPLMKQTFNIRLGHKKSFVGQWWSTLQRESAKTQHIVHEASTSILQQVQAISARLADETHDWMDIAERSEREVVDRVREAKQQIDRQLHEARDEVWMSLRETTAPLRTSRRTLWARNNAYVWRCGFERVVGLSSRDKGGEKTRSCQVVDW